MKYMDILKKESDFKLTEILYIQSNLIILVALLGILLETFFILHLIKALYVIALFGIQGPPYGQLQKCCSSSEQPAVSFI